VTLDAQLQADLDALEARGLLRSLHEVSGLPGPRMRVDGQPVLMLAGANYLDLAGDPRLVQAARDATAEQGTAAGGARLISGNLAAHGALEDELASFLGMESALLFSTGYMANLGVLTALAGPGDAIVSDSLNHASIIDAARLSRADVHVFRHGEPEDLERVGRECAGARRRLLVTDGVFSMDGDTAPLGELLPIARRHDMLLLVDDAHGVGVLGPGGRGTAAQHGVLPDLVIGNLGKALGSFGAFVACSAVMREHLINTARSFIFTCGLPAGPVAAARAGLSIIRGPEAWRGPNLLGLAERLRKGLVDAEYDVGRSSTQIVPILVGANQRTMQLCEQALERGVYAQGIRYPSVPEGTARIRLTPSCGHTPDDIDEVVSVFRALR
jgi:8-amino-7-oxononanoate synthase